jgi:UDPglucose 6-dehydrogenase
MRVCVIGTGYVGLVTGACLAHIGHNVVCVDNNHVKVELMQSGQSPIYEPGLTEIMQSEVSVGRLRFTATKISFINEVANICERVGADVTQVAKGIGLDSRIGNKFLNAGIGWGGSCFPKDVSALINTGAEYGYDAELLRATVGVNQRQRLLVVEKLQQSLKILKGKTIGVLGLTFKPDTDDLRDAPALDIIDRLEQLGASIRAYDPMIDRIRHDSRLTGVKIAASPEELAIDCHAIVLLTEWQEFMSIDYGKLASLVAHPLIVDARNFLEKELIIKSGFQLVSIGK